MKKKIETVDDYWNKVDKAEQEEQISVPIWIEFNDKPEGDKNGSTDGIN